MIKYISYIIFLIGVPFALFGQVDEDYKIHINNQMQYGNTLVSQVNSTITSLERYQEMLNEWAIDTTADFEDLPSFEYTPISISVVERKEGINDYDYENFLKDLSSFQEEIIVFDDLSHQLSIEQACFTKRECYALRFEILRQLESSLKDLFNKCYDFSLNCSIAFGKEELSSEHDRIKDVIAQSKNIIFSLHEKNEGWTMQYIKLLDEALIKLEEIEDFEVLKQHVNTSYTQEEIEEKIASITNGVKYIANLGIQFVNQELTEDQYLTLLNNAIIAFNSSNGMTGVYNDLIQENDDEYIFYLKEPRYFKIKEVEFIDIYQEEEDEEEQSKVVLFDCSKPNNIIILVDVSASMASSRKLDVLKETIDYFADVLREGDVVSLISYSGNANVLLEGATMNQKENIVQLLNTMRSRGGTDIDRGLKMAYNIAYDYYRKDGNNTIIIASDGEFELQSVMYPIMEEHANKGVSVSILHFIGKTITPESIQFKRMAEAGAGVYLKIKDDIDAVKALMTQPKN